MNEYIIYKIAAGLLFAFLYGFAYRAARQEIEADEAGKYLLKVPKIYNIVGYVGIVFGLVMLVGPGLSGEEMDAFTIGLMIFVFAVMCGLGLVCLLLYRNHYVLYDGQGVEVRTISGKLKKLCWEGLTASGINPFTGMITLTDRQGNKAKINQHLTGLSDLMRRIG